MYQSEDPKTLVLSLILLIFALIFSWLVQIDPAIPQFLYMTQSFLVMAS